MSNGMFINASMKSLFSDEQVSDLIRNRKENITSEIQSIREEDILGCSITDYVEYFVGKYAYNIASLNEEHKHLERKETGDAYYITFFVPFAGDGSFFNYRGQHSTSLKPRGKVRNHNLEMCYRIDKRRHLDRSNEFLAEAVQRQLNEELKHVKEYLESATKPAIEFNAYLPGMVEHAIESRKKSILRMHEISESISVPLKKQELTSPSIHVPLIRRSKPKPKASGDEYKPEYELDVEHYEFILDILTRAGMAMEAMPSSYSTKLEDHMRDQMLVVLRTHYEDSATGETFNAHGRADIFVSVDGGQVFIAECKIWSGSKKLISALDQLLSYATWRNTKIALIIFNQRKDFSSVLSKIPSTLKEHPCVL